MEGRGVSHNDRRIDDLLRANNKMVERRRHAENTLGLVGFMLLDGMPRHKIVALIRDREIVARKLASNEVASCL